jgi:hypothetical protein
VTPALLAWTPEPPKVPGWYWLRWPDDEPALVLVWRSDRLDALLVGEANQPIAAFVDCVWAGPLEPPS